MAVSGGGGVYGMYGAIEADASANQIKASMGSEGSLLCVSGMRVGTTDRFTDIVMYYNGGVKVVGGADGSGTYGTVGSRTYSVASEALKLAISVTGSEATYSIWLTGIGGNELGNTTAATMDAS